MPEKLAKTFTRDFSLFITQWWKEAQKERFEKKLGAFYSDAPAASNGLSTSYFYLENDTEAIRQAVIGKLKTDKEYYFNERKEYLENATETRKLLREMGKRKIDGKSAIELLKPRFFALYPMLRIVNFIPSLWREDVKKILEEDAEKTVSAAYEDRAKTEGIFEEIDAVLKKLAEEKLDEIGKDGKLAKFISETELESLFGSENIDWSLVEARTNGYVYCKGKIYSTNDYLKIFRENEYSYEEEKAEGTFVKGSIAYDGGVVVGKVRKIFALEQIRTFQKGEILVTPMTVPDFVPIMKKAAAIVTDEGGMACHAAIVSRELKIPCVVGTKVATKTFSDGETIEVDSGKGTAKKLK